MTIEEVEKNGWLIFKGIVGSRAYGTDLPTSDTDIKGVYVLPQEEYFKWDFPKQVNDSTNDTVYYELGRFIQLLSSGNPGMLELLCLPEDCILHTSEMFEQCRKLLKPIAITKKCRSAFAGYAYQQISKARGRKKKIVNPMSKERKSILNFCWVLRGRDTIPLTDFCANIGAGPMDLCASKIDHTRDTYALYMDACGEGWGSGVAAEHSNEIRLSEVPEGESPVALMNFSQDTYTKYCKDYKEYWEWVEKRNPVRYEHNAQHGKGYDSKNMMHCIRLLRMCKELAETGELNIRRTDREELLAIRRGERDYDDLLKEADEILEALPELFEKSTLPDEWEWDTVNETIAILRIKTLIENYE